LKPGAERASESDDELSAYVVFANQAIRKQMMQRGQRTKKTDRRRLLKLSRRLSLKVPRKSPRKHPMVHVNDKIRVTVTSALTGLLLQPC
jgi:hypothetical protein